MYNMSGHILLLLVNRLKAQLTKTFFQNHWWSHIWQGPFNVNMVVAILILIYMTSILLSFAVPTKIKPSTVLLILIHYLCNAHFHWLWRRKLYLLHHSFWLQLILAHFEHHFSSTFWTSLFGLGSLMISTRNAHMVHIVNKIRFKIWCIHLGKCLYLYNTYIARVLYDKIVMCRSGGKDPPGIFKICTRNNVLLKQSLFQYFPTSVKLSKFKVWTNTLQNS